MIRTNGGEADAATRWFARAFFDLPNSRQNGEKNATRHVPYSIHVASVGVGVSQFFFFFKTRSACRTDHQNDRWAVISWHNEGLKTAEICHKTGFDRRFVTHAAYR